MVIQKDEISKVFITWSMVALLAIGYAIGWSAVHSMLVKRMGIEYLPYTYIGISLLGVLGSSVYLMFADVVRRDRLLMIFSLVTGLMLLFARTLVAANHDGEKDLSVQLVLFFVVVFFAQGVGNSTLGTQVWTIINDLFRPSQGRRLYPIVGTAGTIGGIAGGASIHYLASSLGTANLVLIWAAAILALIPLTWWMRKRFGGELRGRKSGASAAQPAGSRLLEGWEFFFRSKMAVTLGFIAVMFWVVGSLADFQFSRIMNISFPSEAKLAGFYGVYGMIINAAGLLVQLFFSSYLIRRIGVSRGLLALPVTILAGFALVGSYFVFWSGLLMRCSWDLVGMTIQGNSYQLALNAIPGALRARIRGFIDGVINPLGGVIGGLLIIFLHNAFDTVNKSGWQDPVTLSGIVLSALWIIVVVNSQKHYMDMIADNLQSVEQRTVMDAIDCLVEPANARAAAMLEEVAKMQDPQKRAAVARVRASIAGNASLQALYLLLNDPVIHVRAESLRSMAHLLKKRSLPPEAFEILHRLVESDPEPAIRADALKLVLLKQPAGEWQEMARRWLASGTVPVRARVVEAIGILSANKKALLEPMLLDESAMVRAAAVQALWDEPEVRINARRVLSELLEGDDPDAHRAALAVCHLVGDCPDPSAPARMLSSPNSIARILAGAALIRFGADPELRQKAIGVVCKTMAEEEYAGLYQRELLPLLPDLGEEAIDEILFGVARLSTEEKVRVSSLLSGIYDVLNSRISVSETITQAGKFS
ncbi:MAG: MFS transporter [Chlorobiaceae bacterium]